MSRRDILAAAGAVVLSNIPSANAAPSLEVDPTPPQLESIPVPESVTEAEVRWVLGKLIENAPYQDMRKLEDANGLYLLDITVPQSDGHTEYYYRRGRPETEKKELPGYRIDYVTYDKAGDYITGGSIAKKEKDRDLWKMTP